MLIATGLAVGLGAGLGAVAFRFLINWFTYIFFDVLRPAFAQFLGPAAVVPLPALGGLLFGPLILFELTGDYRIILPLMGAIVISTLVSEALSGDTIYTLKLRRRGIDLRAGAMST